MPQQSARGQVFTTLHVYAKGAFMLDASIYHPRLKHCKDPFGAVPLGTQVHFSAGLPTAAVGCTLCAASEFSGAETETDLLPDGRDRCSGVYTAPAEPELVWYFLRFRFADGSTQDYGAEGFAPVGAAAVPFQLTVYDDAAPTPDWFGRGVTYQIFPDRFCRLEPPEPKGMIGNRWVHENWNELMAYQPEDGVITNRDFFGGSLKGILSRLDYLESLSVSTLYLNPIFEAASNHRYDTCDYCKIDPMLGTEKDFRLLCSVRPSGACG